MIEPSTPIDLHALQEHARGFRLDILDMTTRAGSGHPSSSWSCVEILTALFFGGILLLFPGLRESGIGIVLVAAALVVDRYVIRKKGAAA